MIGRMQGGLASSLAGVIHASGSRMALTATPRLSRKAWREGPTALVHVGPVLKTSLGDPLGERA